MKTAYNFGTKQKSEILSHRFLDLDYDNTHTKFEKYPSESKWGVVKLVLKFDFLPKKSKKCWKKSIQ